MRGIFSQSGLVLMGLTVGLIIGFFIGQSHELQADTSQIQSSSVRYEDSKRGDKKAAKKALKDMNKIISNAWQDYFDKKIDERQLGEEMKKVLTLKNTFFVSLPDLWGVMGGVQTVYISMRSIDNHLDALDIKLMKVTQFPLTWGRFVTKTEILNDLLDMETSKNFLETELFGE